MDEPSKNVDGFYIVLEPKDQYNRDRHIESPHDALGKFTIVMITMHSKQVAYYPLIVRH